jgi:hypothetical protein
MKKKSWERKRGNGMEWKSSVPHSSLSYALTCYILQHTKSSQSKSRRRQDDNKKKRRERENYGRFIDEIPFGIRIIFFLEERRLGIVKKYIRSFFFLPLSTFLYIP